MNAESKIWVRLGIQLILSEAYGLCSRNNDPSVFSKLFLHDVPSAVLLGFMSLFDLNILFIFFSYAWEGLLMVSKRVVVLILIRSSSVEVYVLLGLFVFGVLADLLDVLRLEDLKLLAVGLFLDVQNFLVLPTLGAVSISGGFASDHLQRLGDLQRVHRLISSFGTERGFGISRVFRLGLANVLITTENDGLLEHAVGGALILPSLMGHTALDSIS